MEESGIEDEGEGTWEDDFDEEEFWSSVEDELPDDGDDGDGELSDQSDDSGCEPGGDTWAQRGRQHRGYSLGYYNQIQSIIIYDFTFLFI